MDEVETSQMNIYNQHYVQFVSSTGHKKKTASYIIMGDNNSLIVARNVSVKFIISHVNDAVVTFSKVKNPRY